MEHILLLCPWVSKVWFGGPLNVQINQSSITTLAEWVYGAINQNMGCHEDLARSMRYLIFTCWFIWRARCDAILNGVKPSPLRSIRTIITALESFMQASAPCCYHPQSKLAVLEVRAFSLFGLFPQSIRLR
ncbi:hypothetical protein TB1_037518 [Malus domestica]